MGLKLGDISPLAGLVTGKGMMGKLLAQGAGGLLGTAIARDAQKSNEFEEEEKRKQNQSPISGTTEMAKGGKVRSASSRADGIAQRGKTRC